MWFRVILTAFALAVVLYLQFGFNIKDWIKQSATQTTETLGTPLESEPTSPP
ncbi:MAG: hypothetical protein M3Q07_14855 [Pseudobdellovibrionaceae bacterium]|nr:hypothetical protein [Pseudobdellovibrionaceae bacterium]